MNQLHHVTTSMLCQRSADDNHLTWWPLAAHHLQLLGLFFSFKMHICAWVFMSTRTTLDLVCCFTVKQQGYERSWPLAQGHPISILVQVCFLFYHPPSSLSLFSPSQPHPYGMGDGRRKKKKEKADRFYRGLWEPTDKGLHLNPS